MITTLAKVAIADFDRFMAVFSTAGARMRRKYGSSGATVYRVPAENGHVIVLIQWPDVAAFEKFRSDAAVRDTMREGGALGPPEFVVVEVAGNFPA